jgi:hypothetical protein
MHSRYLLYYWFQRRRRNLPIEQDDRVRGFGTKVRLFPQAPYLAGFADPEIVWLSPPAGTVRPGPSDDRMYVVDTLDKQEPYEFPDLPPYFGDAYPPCGPNADGHFDHLEIGTREFVAAHLYGSIRRVIDIFESYLGRRIEWQFQDRYQRLELIPLLDWDNAQSGYGFMEFGFSTDETGERWPFALNFDVIAHEVGHAILFSLMDLPIQGHWTPQFGGFHESAADLVSLISVMHFDSVLDRVLRGSRGNIYTINEINRVGEISEMRQIRLASNNRKMSEVTDEVHDLSRPLTGAFFDMIVYAFTIELHRLGLIGADLLNTLLEDERRTENAEWIQDAFDEAYRNRHFQFKTVLIQARDIIGTRLVATWASLSPNDLSYSQAAAAFLYSSRRSDDFLHAGFRESLQWREIVEPPLPTHIR